MKRARIIVAVIGIVLPYLVRIPRGKAWLAQYLDAGLFGFVLLEAFNAIAWGSVLLLSFRYRHPTALAFPAASTFGFLGFAHYVLDLASSSTASVALVFIPVYALAFVFVGGVIGLYIDMRLK